MPTKTIRQFVLIPFIREKSHHITVVDSHAVSRYKLTLSSASRKGGGVGSAAIRMNYLAKHDLTLFDVDLSDTKVLTPDLSHVNAGLKNAQVEPVVGVLGADVLWRRHAVIDYDKGLMLLST